ncbi:hypothetical protein [Couchioplanes caeruleus]|uniref:Uncharacterized protein n=2 Tax=Couchioplanes caeruleus TaxID=56438 RepID=A0A1K0FNL0_9ACTN|nr:hypothetical protein [Couchioplanes caeruleus]OJF14423.1 hypothetical protein BG844_10005 [Couchioplanes caeruleus subsp. caeruleus]
MALPQLGAWVLEELPKLNLAILRDVLAPRALTEALDEMVLPELPLPERLSAAEAQQLVVNLGFVGASVARHYQERTPGGKETPERAFEGLEAGAERIPFQRYFAGLADRTGTGHDHRDSYASLVRWNVGTVEVRLGERTVAVLPGVFDDGRTRTYTGTSGEENFFALVKKGEAVERAVNDLLEPLTGPETRWDCPETASRVRTATVLVDALRQLFLEFAALPPEHSMPPEHFMDVFRQFAVHWTPGDIPPSGALDIEGLKRDFLLGIAIPDYDKHVRRLFPGLLTEERQALENLMARPTLPRRMAADLGIDLDRLPAAGLGELRGLIGHHHPVLNDWYDLLTAHARAAGSHLMLSKKFLFKPQRKRDAEGLGDRPLVSNRSGTTGMTETYLERLTRARRQHVLAELRPALDPEVREGAPISAVRSGLMEIAPVEVRLVS